jgi:hypothetical protein
MIVNHSAPEPESKSAAGAAAIKTVAEPEGYRVKLGRRDRPSLTAS